MVDLFFPCCLENGGTDFGIPLVGQPLRCLHTLLGQCERCCAHHAAGPGGLLEGSRSSGRNRHLDRSGNYCSAQFLLAVFVNYDFCWASKNSQGIKEVKREYRRRAKKEHPDVDKSPGALQRWRKLSEAYGSSALFEGHLASSKICISGVDGNLLSKLFCLQKTALRTGQTCLKAALLRCAHCRV